MMLLAKISRFYPLPISYFVIEDEVIETTISEFTLVSELFPVWLGNFYYFWAESLHAVF